MNDNPVPASDAWLAQVQEEIIEPARPIIDPHIHLWRKRFNRDYLLNDLWADTQSGHNITAALFVECHAFYDKQAPEPLRSLGETRAITDLALQSRMHSDNTPIAGLIGRVDLRLGNDPEQLRDIIGMHRSVAGHLLKGIRDPAARDPRPEALTIPGPGPKDFYRSTAVRQSIKVLGEFGLSYDAWHYHHQASDFLDMVASAPDTRFVLNHFGTPLGVGVYRHVRDAIFQQWQADIRELARLPNVYAKLGGLAMPDNGFGWDLASHPASSDSIVERQRPYYLHTIECFGPSRCMFESNFPVDRLSVSYSVLWNAFKKMVADFSEDEKDALFRGTAADVYQLD